MSKIRTIQNHLHFTPLPLCPKQACGGQHLPLLAGVVRAGGLWLDSGGRGRAGRSAYGSVPHGSSSQEVTAASQPRPPASLREEGPHSLQTLSPQQLPGGSQTRVGGGRGKQGRGAGMGEPACSWPPRRHGTRWDFGPWFAASAVLF